MSVRNFSSPDFVNTSYLPLCWKNKLICGDSLHVMESLLHYENLRGKVQMIYIDPPYDIKYDSNFQQRVDSTENDEKDQADDVLTIKQYLA